MLIRSSISQYNNCDGADLIMLTVDWRQKPSTRVITAFWRNNQAGNLVTTYNEIMMVIVSSESPTVDHAARGLTWERPSFEPIHLRAPFFPSYPVSHPSTCIIHRQRQGPIHHEQHRNGPADWKACASKTAGGNGGLMGSTPIRAFAKSETRRGTRCPPFLCPT
ncbi:hypothetical protein BDR04DRAFT_1107058 [Suillus decipiens]|nr:hypothetical protein BDR04DRAFT_1107058 [Suillus decipiens]